MGKFENLNRAKWTDSQPSIIPASVAYKLSHDNNRFYMVTWRGDEPLSFTLFEFTGMVSGGYEIILIEGSYLKMTALEFDEWVLVFRQI